MFILRSKINGKAIGIFGSGIKDGSYNKIYDYGNDKIYDYDNDGNAGLWTSNIGQQDSKCAKRIAFIVTGKNAIFVSEVNRYIGFPIRAVYNE